jgi:tRNA A37 N6-isopentenylltransferase MiaA
VLDFHPLGIEFAVRADNRGLGFVDTSDFAQVLAAMNERVQMVVDEGLYEEVRNLRRHVVERFDTGVEALEEAETWEHLRLPWTLRRRLRRYSETPIEFADTIRYRLFRRL